MKFAAVVLLACVAVSSAAFTGSLVKHTQPAVDQAMFQLRLATTTKTAALPQISAIIQHIQNAIQSILASASNTIQNFNNIVRPIIETAIAQIGQGADVVQTIQNAIQQLQGAFQISTRGLGDNIQTAIQFIQNLPEFIQNLKDQLHTAISNIDFQLLLTNAINAVLPADVASLVHYLMGTNQNNKGAIGEWFGSLWGQITGSISNVATQIAMAAQALLDIGSAAVGTIQDMASDYLTAFTDGFSTVSSDVAAALLLQVQNFKDELGQLYDQVVDSLQQQCFSGAHSSNPSCQTGSAVRAF